MSIKFDSGSNLKIITDAILNNKATLFIGSGASTLSGIPDGKTLAANLKKDFPSVDQETNNLTDIFQDLIDDPACGPERLYEYLKKIFLNKTPNEFYDAITQYDWNNIFTTNYDRLIEQAFDDKDLGAKLRRIVEFNYDINLRDKTKIFLYKLMGSADIPLGKEGDMVLSRKQYHENLVNRGRYLQQLRDCLLDSTLVIIGYSGRDRLLFDVIEKTMENRSSDKIPYSFMIVRQEELSTKTLSVLGPKKIIPVNISLIDLIDRLKNSSKDELESKSSPVCYHTVTVETIKIPITETEFNSFSEDFEILTDEETKQAKADKDLFFKGLTRGWAPFKVDLDFKREIYPDLKKRVLLELQKTDPKDNMVLTLSGSPGSGKSTALRRLAYDIYNGGTPVIFLNEHTSKLDYRLIEKFITQLNHKFDDASGAGRRKTVKPLIIIDDAPSLLFDPTRISQYLRSNSKSALILVAGRTGEWTDSWYSGKTATISKNTFELKDSMASEEIEAFQTYLKEKLDINYTGEDIEEKSGASFFASMYTAIDTTHRPLDEIIKGLYKELPADAKKAYEAVCCLHQFGLPFSQLLLARYLDCTTTTQLFEILTPLTTDAIVEDEDQFGNVFYRSQHRIIARKTVEFFLNDPSLQLAILEDVIEKTNFNIRSERSLIERLLIRDIYQIPFSYLEKQQLYKKTTERQEIRSVLHHWGILEMDNNQMKDAKTLLERAMKVKEPVGAFKGEADRNILTSLGVLHSRMAILEYKKDPQAAAKNIELAESYFQKAKTSGFMGEHPYGAHASMLFELSCLTNDKVDKMNYLSGALQIIDNTKKRGIAKKENTYLDEIELKIWAALDNEDQVYEAIEIIADKRNSPRGYYLYAKYLKRYQRSRRDLQRAYDIIVEGLEKFPDDEECATLRIEYFFELYPKDIKQLYTLLGKYAEQTAYPQISLLFEAIVLAMEMGHFPLALKWYKKLERLSKNEDARFEVRRYLCDVSGDRRVLKGRVMRINDQYNGEILCETLPEYPEHIKFRPIGLPVAENDTVLFNLGFPLVGPIARNVRRI